jgi:CheY-like chemotaxis protein
MSLSVVSPTVLVIEDEPVLRSSMVRGLLRDSSAQVVGVATIAEARRMIEQLRPAFIISDLDLPDGTGLEILDILDRGGLHVPILFASAYVPKYSPRIPRRSDIDVREKPIPLRELRSAVERSVGLRATSDGVGPFSATDYIQLACMCHRSVEVALERDGAVVGRVIVRDGELVHAECAGLQGEAAIQSLVYDDELLAHCLTLGTEHVERTIAVGWQAALLDAARLHDEAIRAESGPVWSPRAPSVAPGAEPPFADDDVVIAVSVPPGAPREAAADHSVLPAKPPPLDVKPTQAPTPPHARDHAVERAQAATRTGGVAAPRPVADAAPAARTTAGRPLPPLPRLASTGPTSFGPRVEVGPAQLEAALSPSSRPGPAPEASHELEYQRAERRLRDAEQQSKAPPARSRGPRQRVAFERAYDDAVQALLAKDYEAAYRHFLEAQYHEPDDRRVRANLERLLALGAHGGTP